MTKVPNTAKARGVLGALSLLSLSLGVGTPGALAATTWQSPSGSAQPNAQSNQLKSQSHQQKLQSDQLKLQSHQLKSPAASQTSSHKPTSAWISPNPH